MEYKEFVDYVNVNIKNYLSEEYQTDNIKVEIKDNVLILKDEQSEFQSVPRIDLEAAYGKMQQSSKSVDEFVKGLANAYEQQYSLVKRNSTSVEKKDVDTITIKNNDERNPVGVSARLFLSVMNYKENQKELEEFPHIRKGEYALVVQMCTGEKNEKGNFSACLTVTENIMNNWKLDKQKLFQLASENAKKCFPGEIRLASEYFFEKERTSMLPDGIAFTEVYVLTNKQHFNGSAAMFYNSDLLVELSYRLENKNLALFPAGLDEIYVIPVEDIAKLQDYQELFDEFKVNSKLGEKVLHFDAEKKMVKELDGTSYGLNTVEIRESRREHKR